jgi:hypothetical protein
MEINMKVFYPTLFCILIFSLINQASAQIYVSPDGNDSNPGTFELPFRTLTQAVSVAGPDSLIYMRGGVYDETTTIRLNRSGQENLYIKVWNYPGELPILDFTNQPQGTSSRGFQITHNYWHLKGLEIRYAKDNGIHISGWYNKIEKCRIHHCEDTGLQISNNGGYNLIWNCDSYENYDPLTHGENADGFAPKLDVGPGNEFFGCRAWGNSDDGWDMYEADELVKIDNCWAFANGYNNWNDPNFQGDGNGFKLGGNFVPASQLIIRSVAFDNRVRGFDQNNNASGIFVYNNTAYRNQSRNYSFPATPTSGSVHVLKNNISYLGNNVIVVTSEQIANSWQGFTVTDNDFISLDTSLAKSPRTADSSLPFTDFLRLASGSSLIDAGVDVGLPFLGAAPDLGAFEFGVVPVELTLFTYSVSGKSIVLNWTTVSEINNYGFEIQKKFNDSNFRTIGFVPGSGTTTEQKEYTFVTNHFEQGINIYRLKQVDFSGTFSYSNEIEVMHNTPDEFALLQNFPNPFNPLTKFTYKIVSPGEVTLKVYNVLGKEVSSVINDFHNPGIYEIIWTAEDFKGNSLPSGIYIAKLQSDNQVQTIKLSLIK